MILADAVGELLKRQALRVRYLPGDPSKFYTAYAPSLLDQLAEAVGNSATVRGGRSIPGSRIPLSTEALDLWVAIVTSVGMWADELKVPRKGLAVPMVLRRVAAEAAKSTHEAIARTLARRCYCGRDVTPDDCGRCWVHRIRALIEPELADREIRGAACWVCRTGRVDPETGEAIIEPTRWVTLERDGELHRVPAIVVRVALLPTEDDSGITWVYRMCRACGSEGWLDYTTSSVA